MFTLFNETEFFNAGRKYHRVFNLRDSGLVLWEQFFSKQESDRYYNELLTTSPWVQRRRPMYDKVVLDPRLTAYYGGERGHEWTPLLVEIKEKVEAQCGISFNRVLLNYYRDGNDSVAWHSDTLPMDGVHHEIASVTFGEARSFKVRHKVDKNDKALQADIPLTHGSLLLMGNQMQYFYEHHVPKTKKAVAPRINLTFRIADFSKKKSYGPGEAI
jgi:alkylated DNA repair dioxygenase AlkB